MDERKLLPLLMVFLVASISVNSLFVLADSSDSVMPPGEEVSPLQNPQAIVDKLIVRDRTPWDTPSNPQAIIDNGFGYDIVTTSGLPATDLSPYRVIILAGQQPPAYYTAISNDPIKSKLADFVWRGGVLLAHMAAYFGDEPSTVDLPGATGLGIAAAGGQHDVNDVSVADPTHPIMDGRFGTVTDTNMDGWDWSSHGHFSNLPPNTQVIMVEGPTADHPGAATYVQWSFGRGIVVATRSPLEWGYGVVGGADGMRPLQNEIAFAQLFPPVPVGGTVFPINALELLAPLIFLAIIVSAATGAVIINRRKF